MSYLLDVNVLIAIGYKKHEFHQRVTLWAKGKNLLTCSISEIGFVRVLSGLPEAEVTSALCRELLTKMKAEWKMQLLPDNRYAETLPEWARGSKQVTDGHILDLAQANKAQMATIDAGIPGGFFDPQHSLKTSSHSTLSLFSGFQFPVSGFKSPFPFSRCMN